MSYNWPHPGCVGLWRLNDDAVDDSGEGNDGTSAGGMSYGLAKFANCAIFTGSNYFSLGYPTCLKVADFTLSCWYKGADTGSRVVLFATSGVYIGSPSAYYGYTLDLHSGKPSLYMNNDSYDGNTAVNDNKWHFLMATRDNSAARIYIDGRIDAGWASPPGLFYCNHYPAGYYWAGSFIAGAYRAKTAPSDVGLHPTCRIDEMMVENYAISPEEALNRYLFQMGVLN